MEAMMMKVDGTENLIKERKSVIQKTADVELCENLFDEGIWSVPPIINSGEFDQDYVYEISGDGAKITPAKITRAEAEALVKHYLLELRDISHCEIIYDGTYPSWMRMKVYASKRINDLVESGAVTKECVSEMSDRIFNDGD
jgi:hypothetical protein